MHQTSTTAYVCPPSKSSAGMLWYPYAKRHEIPASFLSSFTRHHRFDDAGNVHSRHPTFGQHLGRTGKRQTTIPHDQQIVGDPCRLIGQMCTHHHGRLFANQCHQLMQPNTLQWINARRRLIKQQNARLMRNRASDAQPSTLSSRQLAGTQRCDVHQSNGLQRPFHGISDLRGIHTMRPCRICNIVEHRGTPHHFDRLWQVPQ